ncbi:MAG TPA: hybrid sensor histidine kinase/response regulator, partial [Bacteroidota bacterium]|nr:hybrid sensor histidine kinase/response regulator [Bacteroidota bacterium]
KLDGIGVFERLKSDPRTQSIPFMYVTGLVEREHVRPGASLGADAMLIKPFLLTDLLATVNDCLSKSHDRIHG